jgi:hypothetical protein
MAKWENYLDLVGGGRIIMMKVDDSKETSKEIVNKVKGCHKIKPSTIKCEKSQDWDKAYDILLTHQKEYLEKLQKQQEERYKQRLSVIAG